jgi:hypothetical protein
MRPKEMFTFIKERYSELTKAEKRFINSALAIIAVKLFNRKKNKKEKGKKE